MADDVERLYQRLLECDDVLEEVLVATRLLRQVDRIYPPVLAIPRLTVVLCVHRSAVETCDSEGSNKTGTFVVFT
jgi:hypothetical protein